MKYSSLLVSVCSAKNIQLGLNPNCPENSVPGASQCAVDVQESQIECVKACNNDPACTSQCSRDYLEQLEKCPCYDSCTDGCPCSYASDYCQGVNDVHLLILSPHPFGNQQKLSWYFDSNDDFIGTETKRVRLDPNYSTRFFMCSFTNSGRRYLVGGDNSRFDQEGGPLPPLDKTQVEILEGSVEKKEDLPFFFKNGLCKTFNNNGQDITLLCASGSPEVEKTNCWTFDGDSYKKVGDFEVDHYNGDLSVWGNSVIAYGKDINGVTEAYNPVEESWSTIIEDSPVQGLVEFSSATVNGNVFAFGGYQFVPVYPFKNVFRFNTNGEWSVLDYEIQSWRFSFRAVSQDNKIFLIGGPLDQPVECWRWNEDETFTTFRSDFITSYWNTYPETFVIGADEF